MRSAEPPSASKRSRRVRVGRTSVKNTGLADVSDAEPEPGTDGTKTRWPTAELLISFVAGLIFAAGLTMSGMTQPDKVIGFLDVKELFAGPFPGKWDPTLGIVMAGAVMIALIGFAATPYASVRPWFTARFVLPTRQTVDGRLIAGAVIFGVGWGLSGYCPGPALATLLTGQIDIAIFVLAMLPGMWLARKI